MEIGQALTAGELIELLSTVPRDTPVLVCEEQLGFAIPAMSVRADQFLCARSRDGSVFYGTPDELQGAWETVGPPVDGVLISPD